MSAAILLHDLRQHFPAVVCGDLIVSGVVEFDVGNAFDGECLVVVDHYRQPFHTGVHFANDTAGLDIPRVLFWPSGSGNDFWRDIGLNENSPPIEINPHLRRLPRLRENGEERLFLNGAGFGLDGYCCAEGNRRRQKSAAPINYTAIAIRGILYDFHPVSAQITVDGKAYTREKVWMAPTMYGRYLGGGMMLAPMQHRSEDGGNMSLLILHDIGRLHILAILSSVYEGKHVKYDQYVEFLRGRHFHVRFDRPTDMQIDGETVSPVTEYEAWRDE